MAVDARVAVDENVGAEARGRARRAGIRHLVQATAYAFAGDRPVLLVVAGPSGVGKSAVARELASVLDAEVFSSDVVRKELLGLAPTARTTGAERDRLYAPETSTRAYAELVARAGRVLAAGGRAIVDATFLGREQRARAYEVGRTHRARVVLLWGSASLELVHARIAARAAADTDASDATLAIHVDQLSKVEPPGADEGVALVRFDAQDDVASILAPVASTLWAARAPV